MSNSFLIRNYILDSIIAILSIQIFFSSIFFNNFNFFKFFLNYFKMKKKLEVHLKKDEACLGVKEKTCVLALKKAQTGSCLFFFLKSESYCSL
jgi:hypothetical protein